MALLRDNLPGDILIYQAGWVHPVLSPPLEHAALAVRDGKILALGPADEIAKAYPKPAARFDYPDGVLIPGLVNAHAHLELSYMKGLVPPREDFTGWIVDLVRAKRTWTREEFEKSTRAGRRELVRGGCTAVGDIVSAEAEEGAMFVHREAELPLRTRAYQEYLGTYGEGRPPFEEDKAKLLYPGLSPHAPYSSDTDLFRRCIAQARENGMPLSTHGAEIRWEAEYLLEGTGPLYDFLVKLGFAYGDPKPWDADRPARLAGWLAEESPPAPLQFVHGTWLGEEEYAALRKIDATVVYCPSSVAYFHDGRDGHPVESLLAAGIPVALGTDSLASSTSLNMPETCTMVKRAHPALEPRAILEMATRSGALSLGFENCGALAPKLEADFVVFESPGARPASSEEALELALLSGFAVPRLHVIAGEPHAFSELSPLKA